nr:hypothetical protein [uncultured archaeon]
MTEPDDENKSLNEANKIFKSMPSVSNKTNNVYCRKVLIEKCRRGREMSEKFLRRTDVFYPDIHNTLDRKETQIEHELVSIFEKLQIQASTKTDKRSLPYNNVIVSRLMLETDVSAMFDSKRIYRKIISELLTKDIYRIRFYIHIETYEDNSNMMAKILGMCGLKYCFRYYVP